ncbi:unnamed protein product [Linum tenue]|uniref:(S)-hydroxynitrile lyase n=1 Tax=Linum tenue TaxID=586396 RepID=A0AAV0R9P8_9ROSI|nr:unnamed protein product [Linum tenue]
MEEGKKHFVLVHGAAHGAWCWYKLIPLLKSSGHKVTALDLGASGVDPNRLDEIATISDYARPLMEFMASLPEDERVVLVGHSSGGLSCALAMETFPGKIAVAVFLSAFMPDTLHSPSFVLDQYCARATPRTWLDTEFAPASSSQPDFLTMLFGPEFLCSRLYQLCSKEDLELAKAMVRPSSLYLHDLSKTEKFTEEGYGSVRRVFVICNEDRAIKEEYQRWMIENYVVERVMEIKESDHMAMLCEPTKLFDCLSEIADNYS